MWIPLPLMEVPNASPEPRSAPHLDTHLTLVHLGHHDATGPRSKPPSLPERTAAEAAFNNAAVPGATRPRGGRATKSK